MSITQSITRPQKKDDAQKPLRVCFVCTGNTCRSPMAEAVANELAQSELSSLPQAVRPLAMPRLEAFSAGLMARDGEPIAENAVLALESTDIPAIDGHDYHGHKAHTLIAEEAESYDLLIGLTREHAMGMILRFPHLAKKITVLPCDIADPYGGSLTVYQTCLQQIKEGVSALLFSGDQQA